MLINHHLPLLQVDLYENGTIAIVEAVSPELGNRVQRVRVQLPGTSPELLGKFREKKIDFAAHSNAEDGGAVFLNLLGVYLQGWQGPVTACYQISEHAVLALRTLHQPGIPKTMECAGCWLSKRCLSIPAGNLAFPLLLVGGLFLLSRRSQVCERPHVEENVATHAVICYVLSHTFPKNGISLPV